MRQLQLAVIAQSRECRGKFAFSILFSTGKFGRQLFTSLPELTTVTVNARGYGPQRLPGRSQRAALVPQL
jgi:hypothetical protein